MLRSSPAPPARGPRRTHARPADSLRLCRACFLAALLHPLPCPVLYRVRLVVRPETVLRRHRDRRRLDRVGDAGGSQSLHGPARRRLPSAFPHPRPRRQIPAIVRRDPCRRRHPGRPHRCPHATHERRHETVDSDLSTRAARPDAHLGTSRTCSTRYASTKRTTTSTGHTAASTAPDPCEHCRNPFQGSRPTRPARHPPTRPPRRHHPRIPPRRLTSTDGILGTDNRSAQSGYGSRRNVNRSSAERSATMREFQSATILT